MSNSFTYLKTETASGDVNISLLKTEIEQELPSLPLVDVVDSGEEVVVVFSQDINDSNDINVIIANHQHLSVQEQVKASVQAAIDFGQELILNFASENVLMGITQAGKTKDVADYLADVTRYAQTGSLYEVINEIDRLIAAGLPTDLEPFVTLNRLNAFKANIQGFLS